MRVPCLLASGLLALGLTLAYPAQAQNDPSFRLHNGGSVDIIGVTVGGVRIFSQGALSSGQHLVIRLPPGQCINAYQVRYRNGAELNVPQLNTCVLNDLDAGFEGNSYAMTWPGQRPADPQPSPANCVPRYSCHSQCNGIVPYFDCVNSCMRRQCP
jgi:hypothetical protein